MEWITKIICPPGEAEVTQAKIRVEMLPVARPNKVEYGDKKEYFVFHFSGTPKKYNQVNAFFYKFNLRMKKISTGRVFLTMCRKYTRKEIKQLMKYYNDPATVEVTQEPTAEELTKATETLKDKFINVFRHKK